MQNVSKWSNDRFVCKIRQILAQIISGTKCDSDKLIFSAERQCQLDRVGLKKGTQWDRKMSKTGVNRVEVSHHVQVWECPPPGIHPHTYLLPTPTHTLTQPSTHPSTHHPTTHTPISQIPTQPSIPPIHPPTHLHIYTPTPIQTLTPTPTHILYTYPPTQLSIYQDNHPYTPTHTSAHTVNHPPTH